MSAAWLPRLVLGVGLLCACTSSRPTAPAPAPSSTAIPSPAKAPPPPSAAPTPSYSTIPRVDVHVHVGPGALPRAIALLGAHGIRHLVNLSGGAPGRGLEAAIAEARAVGHTTVFMNPSFRGALTQGKDCGRLLASEVELARQMGARGVKISKGLGLGYVDEKGKLVAVDDRRLDPLFEMAGRLGMPIAIHTGDPKAFWLPPDTNNERFDELRVHPEWSFYGAPVSWEQLYKQFERRVARHPKTTFIGVHFGNAPEDPALVGRMLDKYKNLYVDTAARVPEIGRVDRFHDPERMRAFFVKYQDRILFGTDAGVGTEPGELMLGSTGETPPGPPEIELFFGSTWRWFETADRAIPSPTPIQGRWTIDGIGLPPEILEKVYRKNAEHLLGALD